MCVKQPCKFVHVLILVLMENLYQLLVVLVNLYSIRSYQLCSIDRSSEDPLKNKLNKKDQLAPIH